jgi:hypothetical protein
MPVVDKALTFCLVRSDRPGAQATVLCPGDGLVEIPAADLIELVRVALEPRWLVELLGWQSCGRRRRGTSPDRPP